MIQKVFKRGWKIFKNTCNTIKNMIIWIHEEKLHKIKKDIPNIVELGTSPKVGSTLTQDEIVRVPFHYPIKDNVRNNIPKSSNTTTW